MHEVSTFIGLYFNISINEHSFVGLLQRFQVVIIYDM